MRAAFTVRVSKMEAKLRDKPDEASSSVLPAARCGFGTKAERLRADARRRISPLSQDALDGASFITPGLVYTWVGDVDASVRN